MSDACPSEDETVVVTPQAAHGEGAADDVRDARLVAALREYTDGMEEGRRPTRRELLARYPDVASDLSACLAGLAFVQSAAVRIAPSPGDVGGVRAPLEGEQSEPLGDFRIVREIGRGGMGVVYEAVQLSLGRRVALKVLPLVAALDPKHLRRFQNEAQAAAQLHHSNIVPVYAVGCERSVHFYAMQLIEGQSLAEVIRQLREVAGRAADPAAGSERVLPGASAAAAGMSLLPADGLSSLRGSKRSAYYQSVARLALQAAEALDYAHRAGVVHRDVKPANLLLDGKGNLWVTDFGLAQMYSDSGLTQSGDLLGTLRYMSPEQASGRAVVLDQRTDVYSLGVTLYELLTLERALPGTSREELLRQIDRSDPRPARQIDPTIPTELETILIKATAKEPDERYASAAAMAEDLRRYLADEPILARPPSLWMRGIKFARRHRAATVSVVVVLLLGCVGFSVSTVLIAHEQGKTQAALDKQTAKAIELSRQRGAARQSFGEARALANFLTRVAADELADSPRSLEVRREMLEAALDYYQGISEGATGAAATAELAEAKSYASKILTELSVFGEFDRVQARARLLAEDSVRKALGLSADQLTRVQRVESDFLAGNSSRADFGGPGGGGPGGPGGGFGGGPGGRRGFGAGSGGGRGGPTGMGSEQQRKRFADLATKVKAALDQILTPAQNERLAQIARQARGPDAFGDADVVAALTLTREQKEEVRRIRAECRVATRRAPPRRGPDDVDLWEDFFLNGPADSAAAARESAVKQVVSKLTPAQATAWGGLTGAPFANALRLGDGGEFGQDGHGPDGRGRDGPGHDGPGGGGPGGPPPGEFRRGGDGGGGPRRGGGAH